MGWKIFRTKAKVVFISMTSSDAENLPRHKDFFFNRNRLNVAISRAQNVAVILFNPNLLLASANTIHEMRLMNNFCKLLLFKIKSEGSTKWSTIRSTPLTLFSCVLTLQ